MISMLRRLLVGGFALALASCAPEGEELCVHDPPLTYATFGEYFMDQYCAGCHSTQYPSGHPNRNEAPAAVNFDHYEGVLQWAQRLDPVVLGDENGEGATMPPGGGPTEEDLLQFEEWLHCEVLPDAEAEEAR